MLQICQGLYGCVTGVLQGCHRGVTGVLWGITRVLGGVLQSNYGMNIVMPSAGSMEITMEVS